MHMTAIVDALVHEGVVARPVMRSVVCSKSSRRSPGGTETDNVTKKIG